MDAALNCRAAQDAGRAGYRRHYISSPAFRTTEEQNFAFNAGKLAAFKVPVKVVFWPETLPRNANGKILKDD